MSENRFERWLKYIQSKIVPPVGKIALLILTILVLFCILEFTAAGLEKVVFGTHERVDLYEDKKWAELHFDELFTIKAHYVPYVGYRKVPGFDAKTFTLNENSIRNTANPCISDEALKIFVFGGSTVWGSGAPDNETIPSWIAKTLCEQGIAVNVTNFGESGYTSTQELIQLTLELRNSNIPDIVVFYDGINDVFSTFQSGQSGLPQNIKNREADFNSRNNLNIAGFLRERHTVRLGAGLVYKHFLQDLRNDATTDTPTGLERDIVSTYRQNLLLVEALSAEYGFETAFFWQPALATKNNLSQDETALIRIEKRFETMYLESTRIVQEEATEVHDISDIFDGHEETLFSDQYHPLPSGNAIVGRHIALVLSSGE